MQLVHLIRYGRMVSSRGGSMGTFCTYKLIHSLLLCPLTLAWMTATVLVSIFKPSVEKIAYVIL